MDHLRSCTSGRGPKTARTAQKISSVSLTIDEIRFRMCGATVFEVSRLEGPDSEPYVAQAWSWRHPRDAEATCIMPLYLRAKPEYSVVPSVPLHSVRLIVPHSPSPYQQNGAADCPKSLAL